HTSILTGRGWLQELLYRNEARIKKTLECASMCSKMCRRHFHRVLKALTCSEVYNAYIKMPTAKTDVPDIILISKKFYPFFKETQGAIDGTHILLVPSAADRAHYQNRK
ncbi:hypothetical protein M422DRAFT_136650, partial [Sphaerobolus stellatus SS14]